MDVQRCAPNQFHHDEQRLFDQVVHGDDVGMGGEPRRDPRLPQEPGRALEAGPDQLDRDLSAEELVLGLPHHSHAPGAQDVAQSVPGRDHPVFRETPLNGHRADSSPPGSENPTPALANSGASESREIANVAVPEVRATNRPTTSPSSLSNGPPPASGGSSRSVRNNFRPRSGNSSMPWTMPVTSMRSDAAPQTSFAMPVSRGKPSRSGRSGTRSARRTTPASRPEESGPKTWLTARVPAAVRTVSPRTDGSDHRLPVSTCRAETRKPQPSR